MAQADFFLKIDGIQGELQDSAHPNEIQVHSISFGVSNAGSGGFGMGSGSGKANVHDMSFTKLVDKASPNLFIACATGKSIGNAIVTMRKAGGDKPVEYLVYKLTEVFVSSSNMSASEGGGIAQESLSLNFSKVEWSYKPQNADGSAGAAIQTGYDIKKNAKV